MFQATPGDSHRRQGPWPHSPSESPGTFVRPAPASSGLRIRLLLPPTSRRPTRGLRPQSRPERAGRCPQASAPGHGNQGPAAPGQPKVLEEDSRWRDGTHYKEPFRPRAGGPQGGEPAGATRGPRRGQHARPDSTRARSALHGPAGPRRGLWGSESFGAVGPRRRPAPGLQLPRNRARPEAPGRCGPGPGGGARGEGRGNYVSQDAARRARGPGV